MFVPTVASAYIEDVTVIVSVSVPTNPDNAPTVTVPVVALPLYTLVAMDGVPMVNAFGVIVCDTADEVLLSLVLSPK